MAASFNVKMPSTYSIFIVNLLTINVEETADTQPRSRPMNKKRINRDRARTCGGKRRDDDAIKWIIARELAHRVKSRLRLQHRYESKIAFYQCDPIIAAGALQRAARDNATWRYVLLNYVRANEE